jgi:predicted Zn-dependent protease
VALPFGRAQETEADRIGLILMAAGYDPRMALDLWERMEKGRRKRRAAGISLNSSGL